MNVWSAMVSMLVIAIAASESDVKISKVDSCEIGQSCPHHFLVCSTTELIFITEVYLIINNTKCTAERPPPCNRKQPWPKDKIETLLKKCSHRQICSIPVPARNKEIISVIEYRCLKNGTVVNDGNATSRITYMTLFWTPPSDSFETSKCRISVHQWSEPVIIRGLDLSGLSDKGSWPECNEIYIKTEHECVTSLNCSLSLTLNTTIVIARVDDGGYFDIQFYLPHQTFGNIWLSINSTSTLDVDCDDNILIEAETRKSPKVTESGLRLTEITSSSQDITTVAHTVADIKKSRACYGFPEVPNTQHSLKCGSGNVIHISQAYYTNNTECGIGLTASLENFETIQEGWRVSEFNSTENDLLLKRCSGNEECHLPGRRRQSHTFSVVEYRCDRDAPPIGAIVGSVIGAGVIVLVVILVIVFLRKRGGGKDGAQNGNLDRVVNMGNQYTSTTNNGVENPYSNPASAHMYDEVEPVHSDNNENSTPTNEYDDFEHVNGQHSDQTGAYEGLQRVDTSEHQYSVL